MEFPDISQIKQAAADRVDRQNNAKRLIMIHTGIPAAISLALTALSYYLSLQIADTGGLGGLGLRSVLETAQNMLQVVSIGFSLFWSISLTAITLRWSLGEPAADRDLLAGFRHWGPVLRCALLKLSIYVGIIILAGQLSSIVYYMTPLSADMVAMVEKMMEDPNYLPSDAALLDAVVSYLPFWGLTLAVLMIPLYYRLRMTEFVLMDAPEKGALHAMRMSFFMTRRNCLKLFRLDLGFWWFYLLELITVVVYYGDLVLELWGAQIPFSSDIMLFVACVTGLVLQFVLYVWRKNRVSTAYALVYGLLKPLEPQPPQKPES